jgi:hypothetical protein
VSIGTISSPALWQNGTVLTPTWAQTVQDNINGWLAGTGPTLKSLQVDGVGGNASVTPSGTLQVSASASGTSLPTPAFTSGAFYKDLVPVAWCSFQSTGGATPTFTIFRGFNIASITRSTNGIYNVNYVNALTDGANACVTWNHSQAFTLAPTFGIHTNALCQLAFQTITGGTTTDPSVTTKIHLVVFGQ